MIEELPPSESVGGMQSSPVPPDPSLSLYVRLRWTIRITGVLMMIAGTVYLGVVAGGLVLGSLSYHSAGDRLFSVVVSLGALGLGILVFRAGLNMLLSVDPPAVRNFSFIFSLIYTLILMRILPAWDLYNQHPALRIVLFLFCLGATHLILKRILFGLLFPPESMRQP